MDFCALVVTGLLAIAVLFLLDETFRRCERKWRQRSGLEDLQE